MVVKSNQNILNFTSMKSNLTKQSPCPLACACTQSTEYHRAQSHRTEEGHHTTEAIETMDKNIQNPVKFSVQCTYRWWFRWLIDRDLHHHHMVFSGI